MSTSNGGINYKVLRHQNFLYLSWGGDLDYLLCLRAFFISISVCLPETSQPPQTSTDTRSHIIKQACTHPQPFPWCSGGGGAFAQWWTGLAFGSVSDKAESREETLSTAVWNLRCMGKEGLGEQYRGKVWGEGGRGAEEIFWRSRGVLFISAQRWGRERRGVRYSGVCLCVCVCVCVWLLLLRLVSTTSLRDRTVWVWVHSSV